MMAPKTAAALPEDVLAEVLRRLAPHVLAVSRRVCRAWRDIIDARLRGRLLSHSVRGLFINYAEHCHGGVSKFFARPSTRPAICGGLDFLPSDGVKVADHCNGLLLCDGGERDYVVNPATRRWAGLPRRPPQPHISGGFGGQSACLAFEPAVSPHYEVFLMPRLPSVGESGESDDDDDALLQSEWPPASYSLHWFSSMADRWDERTFLREGEAAGIVADVDLYPQHHAVYWGSNLYIHSQDGYLTRMSLKNHTYRVIRLPVPGDDEYASYHFGRSVGGVYCARNNYCSRLQLWHLDESRDQTEWVLKHDIHLETFARALNYREDDHAQQVGWPWILRDVKYRKDDFEEYWMSDDNIGINILALDGAYHFLGFHPHEEIVYLGFPVGTGVTYDWNSSKFENLGSLAPAAYIQYGTDASFPYTPCWMGDFPSNKMETQHEHDELLRRIFELDAQLEDGYNINFADEYELGKLRGRTKRVKDSVAKIRRRRRFAAR